LGNHPAMSAEWPGVGGMGEVDRDRAVLVREFSDHGFWPDSGAGDWEPLVHLIHSWNAWNSLNSWNSLDCFGSVGSFGRESGSRNCACLDEFLASCACAAALSRS
jgi:hypothetical protein